MTQNIKNCLEQWGVQFSVALLHTDRKDFSGRGAQDGHLHFHTVPDLCASSSSSNVVLHPETVGAIRDGEPRTATSTFTQLLYNEWVEYSGFMSVFVKITSARKRETVQHR